MVKLSNKAVDEHISKYCQLMSGIIHPSILPFGWAFISQRKVKHHSRMGLLQRRKHKMTVQQSHMVLPPHSTLDTAVQEEHKCQYLLFSRGAFFRSHATWKSFLFQSESSQNKSFLFQSFLFQSAATSTSEGSQNTVNSSTGQHQLQQAFSRPTWGSQLSIAICGNQFATG